mgnify:CR=1 FL=1
MHFCDVSGVMRKLCKYLVDDILEITKTPERQKEFLQCSKGKHAEFFKVGAAHVGFRFTSQQQAGVHSV